VFVLCLGVGPAVALDRLEVGADKLRIPMLCAVPVALIVFAMTGCTLAAVAVSGSADLFGNGAPITAAVAVAVAASLVALVSVTRGLRAERSRSAADVERRISG
jgi:hypothetical protein